jgi:hypothetical protein
VSDCGGFKQSGASRAAELTPQFDFCLLDDLLFERLRKAAIFFGWDQVNTPCVTSSSLLSISSRGPRPPCICATLRGGFGGFCFFPAHRHCTNPAL